MCAQGVGGSEVLVHGLKAGAKRGAERMVRHALTYAAQPYGVARLLAQGYKKLTGWPVTLRLGPGQVICSALIALPY